MINIFLSILALFSACTKQIEKPKEKIIPISVEPIQTKDLPRYLEVHGILTPAAQADAIAQVGGRVIQIHTMEGKSVCKGDVIAEIDSTLYRLKVREAESALAQKRAQLHFAQKKLERYLSLRRDTVAAIEYDQLQQEVSLHEAAVLADEARLEYAMIDLENCQVKAPITGKIGRSHVQAESWIAPKTTLGTIRNVDSLYIEFALSESELSEAREGCPMQLRLPGQTEWRPGGTVIAIDTQIDQKSGMVQARGKVANVRADFWPGQFVQARLLLEVAKEVVLLPLQAIQQKAEGKFVYVIDRQQKLCERIVTLGAEHENEIAILSGLEPDDLIVVKGQTRLYPGAKFEIK
ncbi:MAG: efflux RND transporter periplasmic adaptor subunit [Verrucomicrobia bacterium]|nr:efflux RND transporter periplasmic adaptor subunit [Verrucomicrobiota bacterium]